MKTSKTVLLVALSLAVVHGGAWAQKLIDPPPRQCQTLGAAKDVAVEVPSRNRINEYPAGGVLMALAQVPAGVKGVFEFYLCPEEGNDAQEECLIRVPLQLADGSGYKFQLENVAEADVYEIPLVLPDEVACQACSIQWRVVTKTCADTKNCNLAEETFCSDISIRQINTQEKRLFGLLMNVVKGLVG